MFDDRLRFIRSNELGLHVSGVTWSVGRQHMLLDRAQLRERIPREDFAQINGVPPPPRPFL